jgi:hypothetical protein
MRRLLLLNSLSTMMCGAWLAFMEMLLWHPEFASRPGVAMFIAATGLATLLVCLGHVGARNERWLWAAAGGLIMLGALSLLRNARAPHFEGFVFVISVVIVLQGLLILGTLGRQRPRNQEVSGG